MPLGIFSGTRQRKEESSRQQEANESSVSSSSPSMPLAETRTTTSSPSPPSGAWQHSSSTSLKKLGTTVKVTEITRRPMEDAHGIDLSSLSGSAHYYGADPLFRGHDSPDSFSDGTHQTHHYHHHQQQHHHDQVHDARASLLYNAQEPGYGGYAAGPQIQQQHQQQQQQHKDYEQIPRHDQQQHHQQHPLQHPTPPQQLKPPGPPPYVAANCLGPPNEPSKSFRMRKPHWHSSWNMYVWLLLGIAFAIGHHAFYQTLDGKPADDQVRMLRYGTILAFAAKASLGAAVISAYQQRIWTTVRSRLMSIAALDSMFAATENFIALLNWEFLKSAKAAAALALFVWLSPLVVILTANTLVVQPETTVQNTTCPGVRSLNFAMEGLADWRKPVRIDGLYEMPLSFWNTTKPADEEPAGWFDYYTAPSPNFQQTATLGAFFQEVVARKNASVEICTRGWNCTFQVQFTAPGYKCQELARGIGSQPKNLTQESGGQAQAPFGTDLLLPKGTFAYYAFTSGGEYSTMQMKDVDIGGIPKTKPPYPPHMGAFRTEPVVWIGHVLTGRKDGDPAARVGDGSNFVPTIFACEHYETEYTAVFNYTDATQSAYMKSKRFVAPIINTTYIPGLSADDGTTDNVTAIPEENYVLPSDVQRYRRTAAYHSLGFMLRKFLNGTVQTNAQLVNPVTNTDAIQTKLLDPRNNFFPREDLMDAVQGFYEDLILSIFSMPQFLPVVWAAAPGEMSGQLREGGIATGNSTSYRYPCRRSRVALTYRYHARDLWIVYAVAIALALSGVAAGAMAVRENGGVLRNTRFSSIVAATRGPALEKVNWEGPDRDRGDVPTDVKRLKLGYGVMSQGLVTPAGAGAGVGYPPGQGLSPAWTPNEVKCGFGLPGDVNQNKREGSLFHK